MRIHLAGNILCCLLGPRLPSPCLQPQWTLPLLHTQEGIKQSTFENLSNRLRRRPRRAWRMLKVSLSGKKFSRGSAEPFSPAPVKSSLLSWLPDFWVAEGTAQHNCNRQLFKRLSVLSFHPSCVQEFDPIWFLPPSSYLRQWFEASDTFFPSEGERWLPISS